MCKRAFAYVQNMEEIREHLVIQLGVRMEQVVFLEGEDIPMAVKPRDYFSLSSLDQLIGTHALFVPFKDLPDGSGLRGTLQEVVQYLTEQLYAALRGSCGVGRFAPTWKAFQAELALEEMFYGHPLSPRDNVLSAALGTSTVNGASLSHKRGFIGLAPYHSVTSEEEPPPLHHWTRDQLQKTRIQRIWVFCQSLEAGPAVIGAALIKVLLGDLYKRNEQLPWVTLKGTDPPGRLVGAWKVQEFSKDLATKKSFPVPHTFQRARELVAAVGKDVEECLLQGFLTEGIVFFPQISFRDTRRAHRLWWNYKDWVHLHSEGVPSLSLSQEAQKTLEVLAEFQRRGLSFEKNLEVYKEHGMPWMRQLLARIPQSLKGGLLLKTLTFVSCVGAIQSGVYVDYRHLLQLVQEMSVGGMPQAQLQKLQILGKVTLEKVKNVVVWKLHPDLPHSLVMRSVAFPELRRPAEDKEDGGVCVQPEEDVQAVDDQDDIRPAV